MALELFKPFVMNRLVINGYAHNIKSAKRLAESARPEVVGHPGGHRAGRRPVLLNRAPTLHRLGIQAFQPILVDGGAIRVHPLVCLAFNADFDGDQMAVHVPLSKGAVQEAKKVMLSSYNMLSPSSGEPIVAPTLDIAFGCYYLTEIKDDRRGEGRKFASFEDARLAYEMGNIDLHAKIQVRHSGGDNGSGWMDTTVGADHLQRRAARGNGVPKRGAGQGLPSRRSTAECFQSYGNEETLKVLDAIKNLGFEYASKSGTTIAINDIEVPSKKEEIVGDAEMSVAELEDQYLDGLITEDERHRNTVEIWTKANDDLTGVIEENMENYGGIYLMAVSGAKGNIAQIKQMAGMRGLMASSKGHIIDRPIKSSFREGAQRPRVLHLDPRVAEGPVRHGPPDGRQRLSDAQAHRRGPGGHDNHRRLRRRDGVLDGERARRSPRDALRGPPEEPHPGPADCQPRHGRDNRRRGSGGGRGPGRA